MKIRVVCAGTFDHLHAGHIDFLRQARSLGNELIVIVARDENVKRIKKILPGSDENKRKEGVTKTGIAEKVILGSIDKDIFAIIGEINPNIIALGYDQRVSETAIKDRFPDIKVVRLNPFHPDKYKSSIFRSRAK
ncbi:MAG: FAD synthase [Nitrospiraceae bacterium]|nr:FAD synthase [Nitrospiraceae bacterium]